MQVFKLKGADRKHKQDRDKINKRPIVEQEKFSPSYECTVLTDIPAESIYITPGSAASSTTSAASMPLAPLAMGGGGGDKTSRANTPNRIVSTQSTNSSIPGTQPGNAVTQLQTNKDSSSPSLQTVVKNSPQNLSSSIYPPTSLESIPLLLRTGSPALFGTDRDLVDANALVGAVNSSNLRAVTAQMPSDNELVATITSNSTPEMVMHWLSTNRYTNHINSFRHFNGRDILRYDLYLFEMNLIKRTQILNFITVVRMSNISLLVYNFFL